eukprot:m.16236 g.16236  ORF g.16236 m.16236 type:complete len:98 (+) comp26808_c0_seq1:7432-7725(+)
MWKVGENSRINLLFTELTEVTYSPIKTMVSCAQSLLKQLPLENLKAVFLTNVDCQKITEASVTCVSHSINHHINHQGCLFIYCHCVFHSNLSLQLVS